LVSSEAIEIGYQIQEHWLQLFGICPDCKRKTQEI
jgi:Fe2+ or Zn2+ uptake regulation protein